MWVVAAAEVLGRYSRARNSHSQKCAWLSIDGCCAQLRNRWCKSVGGGQPSCGGCLFLLLAYQVSPLTVGGGLTNFGFLYEVVSASKGVSIRR